MYSDGDYCDREKQVKFSSQILFICDPNIEFGKPVYQSFDENTDGA
jgi:hypothetical protein